MKRTTKGKRTSPRGRKPAARTAGPRAKPGKRAAPRPRPPPARKVGAPKAAPAKAPRRRAGRAPRVSLVQPVDLERQLADPVEAAQEDLKALPEQALFDRDGSGRDDDLAELLGEEYVRSVTSGEEQGVELRDEAVPEEDGGPFVETSANKEFGYTADDSEPEALPLANRERTRHLR